ncbi:MAG: hypothetical protein ACYCX6_01345 [Vulcanimicrobiaceae bacterium]
MRYLQYDRPVQDRELKATIELPVTEDQRAPLAGHLSALLTPLAPFRFRMEDAIRAVERHVFVDGLADNPIPIVESAVAAFTWEFDTYWTVDSGQNAYYPSVGRGLNLTIEHVARTGELIAEGIALQFLEQRLNVSRAACRFIAPDGNAPRLDYAFTPIHGTSLAAYYPGKPKMRLEVRSRKEMQTLQPRDYKKLTRKKKGHQSGQTLAIYCCYGFPDGIFTPQIILADPIGEPDIVTEDEAVEAGLMNYERVTSRIGLWEANSKIRAELRARNIGDDLPPLLYERLTQVPPDDLVTMKQFEYRGRFFPDRLLEAEQDVYSAREALVFLNAGDYGKLKFQGLREEALQLIYTGSWSKLCRYIDTTFREDATITGDGVMRRAEPVDPESEIAEQIREVIRKRAGQG